MTRKNTTWSILLLTTLVLIAALGPGTRAWARPGHPAQTVPTPTPSRQPPPLPSVTATNVPSVTDTPAPAGATHTPRPPSDTETPVPPPPADATATPIPPAADTPLPTELPAISITATVAAAPAAPAVPELTAELVADPPWGIPGRSLAFRLTVRNVGADNASGLTVRGEFPTLITPRTASVSQGESMMEGQIARLQLGAIAPGATVSATIEGLIAPDAPPGAVVDVLFALSSAEGYQQSLGVTIPLPPAELPPTGREGCLIR